MERLRKNVELGLLRGTPLPLPPALPRCEDMLPSQLLTPFQAEREQATRDVYNYAQVQVGLMVWQSAGEMGGRRGRWRGPSWQP